MSAKLPTLADHAEPVDIASPPDHRDSPSDYTDAEHAAAEAGGVDFDSGPPIEIASDTADTAPAPSAASPAAPKKLSTDTFSSAADTPTADDLVTEPAAPEAEADVAPEFAPEILERAQKRYGIDAESAKRFGSVENLEWAMAERDRVAAEWGQKQLAAMQQQPAAPQAPQAQQPAAPQLPAAPQVQQPTPAQQQAVQQILAGYKFDRAKLAEKGFDDDTISELEGITGHFNSQLEKAGQYIQSLTQHAVATHQESQQRAQQITGQSQAEEEARIVRDADAFFDKLDPEWNTVFGKGSATSLKDGAELDGRRKVFSAFLGLKFADAQSNQQTPDAELWQSALSATHFTKQQEIARKALAEKAGRRRTQVVARAGAQRAQPMTGDEKAYKRAAAFEKKHHLVG